MNLLFINEFKLGRLFLVLVGVLLTFYIGGDQWRSQDVSSDKASSICVVRFIIFIIKFINYIELTFMKIVELKLN